MPLTFDEYYNGRTGLTVGVNDILFSEQTEYQRVEVYETDSWGNLMVIDGMVMLSERDEFVYHEMLAHVALFSHPDPRRVLIVGGGDGGTAREVMRHASVETVDLVEIDEAVVRASRQFLPEVGDWDNPKLNLIHDDGIRFVKDIREPYDIIIVDGSDPVGPAEGLFEKEFLQSCHEGLSKDGVLTAQTESPWVEDYHKGMERFFKILEKLYANSSMYLAYIPLYPAGMWSFAFASKGVDPLAEEAFERVEEGMEAFGDKLGYYNSDMHTASFALPGFVREIINRPVK